jgi:TRAP-type C4-dicarboxylate transport system permease small subunit
MPVEAPVLSELARPRRRIMSGLAWAHDQLSHTTFVLGGAVCGYIAVSLCYEVAARYAFGAPTQWTNPFSNFGLCIAIFAALPELTRRGAHVSISIVLAKAPGWFAAALQKVILVSSALTCFAAALICGRETWGQFRNGIRTISAVEVPKWMITIFIVYGLASAAIYFIRELATADVEKFRKELAP